MAKIYRLPKDSRNTVINANIGDTSDTLQLHIQVPSHHVQRMRLLELKAPTGKNWPSQMGVVLQTKKMDLSLLELESTTLNPTRSPQKILEGQASTKP